MPGGCIVLLSSLPILVRVEDFFHILLKYSVTGRFMAAEQAMEHKCFKPLSIAGIDK